MLHNTTRPANDVYRRPRRPAIGFTLVETMTSLILLGMIGGTIVITIDRCVDATLELSLRKQALSVAQENMEQALTSLSLAESVEQGTSDLYPNISWETTIETFSEPAEGKTWARVICSASFDDEADETQTIELTHWLTAVKDQGADGQTDEERATQELEYEEALAYAGDDTELFAQWIEWGLKETDDGKYIKYNLDIFSRANGAKPKDEELALQVDSIEELEARLAAEREEQGLDTDGMDDGSGQGGELEVGENTTPSNTQSPNGSRGQEGK